MEQALLQACRDKGDKTENRHKVKEAETMLNSTDSESEEQQRDTNKFVIIPKDSNKPYGLNRNASDATLLCTPTCTVVD